MYGRIFWHWQPKGPATRMADLNCRATPRLYYEARLLSAKSVLIHDIGFD